MLSPTLTSISTHKLAFKAFFTVVVSICRHLLSFAFTPNQCQLLCNSRCVNTNSYSYAFSLLHKFSLAVRRNYQALMTKTLQVGHDESRLSIMMARHKGKVRPFFRLQSFPSARVVVNANASANANQSESEKESVFVCLFVCSFLARCVQFASGLSERWMKSRFALLICHNYFASNLACPPKTSRVSSLVASLSLSLSNYPSLRVMILSIHDEPFIDGRQPVRDWPAQPCWSLSTTRLPFTNWANPTSKRRICDTCATNIIDCHYSLTFVGITTTAKTRLLDWCPFGSSLLASHAFLCLLNSLARRFDDDELCWDVLVWIQQ